MENLHLHLNHIDETLPVGRPAAWPGTINGEHKISS
jgi:hypothetical protein